MFGAQFLRERGDAAEIEERAAVLLIRLGRVGVRKTEVVERALPLVRPVRVPEALQDLDDLAAALIPDLVALLQSRHIGGDDVEAEPTFRDVIHRGNSPGEHGRPDLAHAQRDELVDLSRLRSHRGGKAQGVLPNDPAGGQQDVLEPMAVGAADNLAAMFKAGAQPAIGYAEKFIIIAAERGEPGQGEGIRRFRAPAQQDHDRRIRLRRQFDDRAVLDRRRPGAGQLPCPADGVDELRVRLKKWGQSPCSGSR